MEVPCHGNPVIQYYNPGNLLVILESQKAGKLESTTKKKQNNFFYTARTPGQYVLLIIYIIIRVLLYTRASFYVILTTIEVYIHKENNTISSIHVKNTINNNSINVNDGTNNH